MKIFQKDPVIIFIGLLILFLLVQTLFSLWWRVQHDAALLQYIAHLILEQNRLPYRDIFDINLPGTHFFFILWIKVFGYGDFGFRLLDVIWSAGVLSLIYKLLLRFGKQAAWVAVALIGLSYISFSPVNSLQREWILALPILLAVWLTVYHAKYHRLRIVAIGILAGLAFLIKPHAILFLLPVGLYHVTAVGGKSDTRFRSIDLKKLVGFTALSGAGFMVALSPALIYLFSNDIFDDLLEIMLNYWPLYSELSGGHYLVSGMSRLKYLVSEAMNLGGNLSWIMAALFGSYLLFSKVKVIPEERRIILLYAGLSAGYLIYPVLSGQFWWYHWIPFLIFVIMLFCSTAFNQKLGWHREKGYFLIGITAVSLMLGARLPVAPEFFYQLVGIGPRAPNGGRVDEIEAFLKEHLQPGDTVQPLDWTSGAVHGMLRAKAKLATSFIWDMQFYHHIDNPYNSVLRQKFMSELNTAQPRFIIEVYDDAKPWPMGKGTTREFPELRNFISEHYIILFDGNGYRIYATRNDILP